MRILANRMNVQNWNLEKGYDSYISLFTKEQEIFKWGCGSKIKIKWEDIPLSFFIFEVPSDLEKEIEEGYRKMEANTSWHYWMAHREIFNGDMARRFKKAMIEAYKDGRLITHS